MRWSLRGISVASSAGNILRIAKAFLAMPAPTCDRWASQSGPSMVRPSTPWGRLCTREGWVAPRSQTKEWRKSPAKERTVPPGRAQGAPAVPRVWALQVTSPPNSVNLLSACCSQGQGSISRVWGLWAHLLPHLQGSFSGCPHWGKGLCLWRPSQWRLRTHLHISLRLSHPFHMISPSKENLPQTSMHTRVRCSFSPLALNFIWYRSLSAKKRSSLYSFFSDPSCELCGFFFENRKALASHARAHLRQFGVTEWCVNGSPIETLSAWMRSRPQKVLEMHRSYMQGNRTTLKKVRSGSQSLVTHFSQITQISAASRAAWSYFRPVILQSPLWMLWTFDFKTKKLGVVSGGARASDKSVTAMQREIITHCATFLTRSLSSQCLWIGVMLRDLTSPSWWHDRHFVSQKASDV